MQRTGPPSVSELKAHDDKTIFRAHNDKANFSRNTKRACVSCGSQDSEDASLKVCTGCKRMWYCSGACQKSDWKRHKPFCKSHQETQAAMERDTQILKTLDGYDMPPLTVIRDMLEDFANLHHRVVSIVVGHELGSRSTAFPPLDVKKDCIALTLKMRDPNANPASIFAFTGGSLPCHINGLDSEKQRLLAPYSAKLSDTNVQYSSQTDICFIPALIAVEQPPFLYITTVELRRPQLDLNLLKKTVPEDAPWWAQLEYNAQKGLVVRRHWNERIKTYVEMLGTLKQGDDASWRWEKANDSRGNQKAEEEMRARKKLLRKQ
ncbi:unnamed protein product [Peniophora sp. CBMAI 1063]|nr:unnamed protein product [Peniophora sp. CBMAI 1063]